MTDPVPAVEGRRPMPTPTRVAVILLALLGVLLLAYAALLWLTRQAAIEDLTDRGADRDDAAASVLLFMLAYGVIGLAASASAVFLPRRRGWARGTGIVVTSLLTVLMLLSVLFTGPTPVSLLVLVAAVAGLTSLLSGGTRQWVRETPTA